MNCHKHPEREGTLAVDLPSIGIRAFLCDECKDALTASLSQYKGKREAWEYQGDYLKEGDVYSVRGPSGTYRAIIQSDYGENWK